MQKIVWNGCDAYTEVDRIQHDPDVDFDGDVLWTRNGHHEAFYVREVSMDEIDFEEPQTYYMTDSGHCYVQAWQ